MEWNQFKLKVSNDNLSKNVNWYDILNAVFCVKAMLKHFF